MSCFHTNKKKQGGKVFIVIWHQVSLPICCDSKIDARIFKNKYSICSWCPISPTPLSGTTKHRIGVLVLVFPFHFLVYWFLQTGFHLFCVCNEILGAPETIPKGIQDPKSVGELHNFWEFLGKSHRQMQNNSFPSPTNKATNHCLGWQGSSENALKWGKVSLEHDLKMCGV